MMMIPAQVEVGPVGPEFYGMGSMTLFDATGNEVFAQSIHNTVVDSGEQFIIDQVFQDGTAPVAENISIATICVTKEAGFADGDDLETATTFDTNDLLTSTNCKEDTAVTDGADGTATIGALTFDTTNLDAAGDTITGIGICQAQSASDADFNQCGTAGILFAAFNVADTQLNAGESVQISYTFNISAT